jgi:hypothetical protein
MEFENFERGYLLPRGCKDLIDVINLQTTPTTKVFLKPGSAPPNQPPAMKGELLVSEHATVKELAALLGQKPFKILADAMQLGLFVTINQPLGFKAIFQIAAKYGYTAKR